MSFGSLGGLLGTAIGLVGGLIGTYFAIRNTRGPKERALMVRAAIGLWAGVVAFLALVLRFPPVMPWIWLPYSGLLLMAIRHVNRRQLETRRLEQSGRD